MVGRHSRPTSTPTVKVRTLMEIGRLISGTATALRYLVWLDSKPAPTISRNKSQECSPKLCETCGFLFRFSIRNHKKTNLDNFFFRGNFSIKIETKNVIDTLEIARLKYPGSQNSLDVLCKRFNINNSKRDRHSALTDCHLLREVYINLLDQKAPKLNLESSGVINSKFNSNARKNNNISRKIIKLSDDELELHKKYLQSQLSKNNYNWLFFLSLYIFSKSTSFMILMFFIPACENK